MSAIPLLRKPVVQIHISTHRTSISSLCNLRSIFLQTWCFTAAPHLDTLQANRVIYLATDQETYHSTFFATAGYNKDQLGKFCCLGYSFPSPREVASKNDQVSITSLTKGIEAILLLRHIKLLYLSLSEYSSSRLNLARALFPLIMFVSS